MQMVNNYRRGKEGWLLNGPLVFCGSEGGEVPRQKKEKENKNPFSKDPRKLRTRKKIRRKIFKGWAYEERKGGSLAAQFGSNPRDRPPSNTCEGGEGSNDR